MDTNTEEIKKGSSDRSKQQFDMPIHDDMKTLVKILTASLLLSSVLLTSVLAVPLSPALEHIAAASGMVKCGNSYAGVLFSAADFENAAAVTDFDTLTITSLPAAADGTLYLGAVPVAVNQSISQKSLDSLKFVPAAGTEEGSFTFSIGRGYTMECVMKITDEINFAPVAASYEETVAAWTQRDITCVGSLDAYDPEGDALVFEIVDYQKKGLLVMNDATHGDFRYTPYVGCSGTDFFTYRVRDSYGNYSGIATANVSISRKNHGVVFSDMSEHWAHSAAIEMCAAGIMDYAANGADAVFMPDKAVSREDFLVMVMRALGADLDDEAGEIHTVFADDDEISAENKAYVSAAYNAGIIKGREENGIRTFAPDDTITRAEAAVMINNILGAEVPLRVSLFTDNDTVPAWAQSALYALNDLGILKGTGAGTISPYATLNRAQAAQILLNLTQYVG